MARIVKVPVRLWVLLVVFVSSGVVFNIFTTWLPRYVAVNCANIDPQYAHVPPGDYFQANVLWIIPAILSVAISRYTIAYELCLVIWGIALLIGVTQVASREIELGSRTCVELFYEWRLVAQLIPLFATIAIAVLALVAAVVAAVGRKTS
jgi:hypothetical protein